MAREGNIHMIPAVKQHASRAPLKKLYQPVAAEMGEVERILHENLRSRHPFVDELVRYGCHLGGKRLRPALLLLTGKAIGPIEPAHLTLAVVVEMIHAASLVHDDVLDEATTRRHLATVNSRWDNEASVLLGDFLFSRALHLASTLETTYACRVIGMTADAVVEGELRQKGTRGDFSLGEDEYLSIIEAKTGELYACSCRLGAHFAGASRAEEDAMTAYGRYLGIAFQIADDLLDLIGDEATTGKSLGTDLEKQKPTLPVIRMLELAEGRGRDRLLEILDGEADSKREVLMPYLEQYDAIAYTHARATQFAERARAQLANFPPSDSLDALHGLTDFVVTRSL